MASRDIVTVPREVLTTPSRPVEDPRAEEIQALVADMKETVKAADGVGLAAPQIGVPLRVIVIAERGTAPYGLVNPEIVWASPDTSLLEEGCLSIPGSRMPVRRPAKVRIRALDERGSPVELTGADLLAKIFQHEIDHINGVLITDHSAPGSAAAVPPR